MTRDMMSQAKLLEGYLRYQDDCQRYEVWPESVDRVMRMHETKYKAILNPELVGLIEEVRMAYTDKLFLGAQRALQFGGKQLLSKHGRLYNCTATFCDRPKMFNEAMWWLLCGAGTGFSVQKHHIKKLPEITNRSEEVVTYVIPDSIEGWADSIAVLLSSFFVTDQAFPEYMGKKIHFDGSKIRPKGAEISGGFKAPGPIPLLDCLTKIELLLKKSLQQGQYKIKTIVAYDILMYIADAVIAGGVRRSATICMFSKDDEDMLKAKTGDWSIENPQRGRSNNSVVLLRDEVTEEEFKLIMKSVKEFGEPGFILTDSLDFVFNPCVEVGMRPISESGESGWQACNLTEINGSKSIDKETFFLQCKIGSILGTLQAGYTKFDYLTKASQDIIEREALIGVGITGYMNNPDILLDEEILKEGARVVKYWNKKVAGMIGINQAARCTVVKPSGNASVILGTASGIHGEHSKIYLRHVQMLKDSDIAKLIFKTNPEMCATNSWNSKEYSIAFPIESPSKSIFKSDLLGVKQLEVVKLVQNSWISEGKNEELCTDKRLTHNVSNTITVDDWDEVTDYIYKNRYSLCGVSFLPATGDRAYYQAPYTEVKDLEELTKTYGTKILFASALIENALKAFGGNLWVACDTALGFGEKLSDKHYDLNKRDFVRRLENFSTSFMPKEKLECIEQLEEAIALCDKELSYENLEAKRDDSGDKAMEILWQVNMTVKRALNKELNSVENLEVLEKAKILCVTCLKDVYVLHKYTKIQENLTPIDWSAACIDKQGLIDADTLVGAACSGGACEI